MPICSSNIQPFSHPHSVYPPLSEESAAPVILYLPSGPILKNVNPASDEQVIAALSAASNATIVRINYRTGHGRHYPLPIHDVLTAFDWVKEWLGDISASGNGSTIGVCGQLLGGSLAAMLAMTECRQGQTRIAAAALNAPIVNWIFPDGEQEPDAGEVDAEETRVAKPKPSNKRKKKKYTTSWEEFRLSKEFPASSLLKARAELFKNPDSYFDPFASPLHFFRSPSIEVPEDLSRLPYDPDRKEPAPVLRRKSRRAYPPTGSELVLPTVRLGIGDASVLRSQTEEFMDMLRSSEVSGALKQSGLRLGLVEKYADLESPQKAKIDTTVACAEKKFTMHSLPGIGLWGHDQDQLWREDVISAGQWLREALTKR